MSGTQNSFNYENVAKVCHEANKAYCETIGDNSQPSWEEAPAWQRESAINGVIFHFNNENTTPADSHNSWLKEKEEQGWKYGEVKDPEKKEHPCFVPYEQLPKTQQVKDYIFKNIVEAYKQALFVKEGLTFGEKAVGLNFNPSGDDKVGQAKKLMANAIDLLEQDHAEKVTNNTGGGVPSGTWTRNVLRTAAFNALIAAQMALVKYLTWKD